FTGGVLLSRVHRTHHGHFSPSGQHASARHPAAPAVVTDDENGAVRWRMVARCLPAEPAVPVQFAISECLDLLCHGARPRITYQGNWFGAAASLRLTVLFC